MQSLLDQGSIFTKSGSKTPEEQDWVSDKKGRELQKHLGQYQSFVLLERDRNSAVLRPEHLKWVQKLQELQNMELPSTTDLEHTEQGYLVGAIKSN